MPKKKGIKQLSKKVGIYWDFNTKYFNWTPSIATVYRGHIWPVGLSVKFLWFGATIINVGK